VQDLVFMTDDGQLIPTTISLGVATLRPFETFDSLVERADHAMYAAKVAGRNRVEVATDGPTPVETNIRAVAPTSGDVAKAS